MPEKKPVAAAGKVSEAVESLQLSEVSQANSILLDQKLHQQVLDQEIEKAINLHQRLFTRSTTIETLSLNLKDGRESLNTLIQRGPESVRSMRDDIESAKTSLAGFLANAAPPTMHSWLADSPSMRRAMDAMNFRS